MIDNCFSFINNFFSISLELKNNPGESNVIDVSGRLLDTYPGKCLPMLVTLLIEHDED